jgi:3-methylcrotonyl-CoA carboxylase alpha subunit
VDTGFIERNLAELVGAPANAGQAAGVVLVKLEREMTRRSLPQSGPWGRRDAFELTGLPRRTTLALDIEGMPQFAEVEWSSDGLRVASIGGAAPASPDEGEIVWDGDEAFVLQVGRQLHVKFPDTLARDVESGATSGEVLTPMHGRILAVAVSPDANVQRGDPLFSLEAMKMEHGVVAPISGTVKAVRIAPGEQVQEGAVAVVIEPDPVD